MPAVLTHKAIMLLARERLAEVRDALRAKAASTMPQTTVDRRVLQLATEAHRILSQQPHPNTEFPGEPYMRPLGQNVSKLAVFGSMGPDLTGFSAALAPGQSWVFDTIHKGYPDGHREAVVAATCEFALAFWRQASAAVTAAVPHPTEQQAQLDRVRAYVLGHLCHVAADVVSHPLINDLEWHAGTREFEKLDHADGEGSHDALVAQKVFRRRSTREGQSWDAWWPTHEELPPGFLEAYKEALEDVYKARSNRRTGLTEFEDHLRSLEPPVLDSAFLRDGFAMFRSILSIVYGWGGWSWFGFTAPIFLTLMALPLFGIALPQARQFFLGADAESDGAQGTFEYVTLPVTLGSFLTLGYGIWLTTLTTHGVTARMVLELIGASVNTVLGIVFLSTTQVEKFSLAAKYPLLLAVPAATAVLNLVLGIIDNPQVLKNVPLLSLFAVPRKGYERRSAISFWYAFPTVIMLVGALLNWLIFKIAREVSSDGKVSPEAYGILTAIWVVLIGVAWFVLPFTRLRNLQIPERPGREAEDPHFVRLFDDATVHRGRSDAGPPGTLERFFSAGRRKLIQLWWEGAGDLFIRVDRYRLVCKFTDDEAAATQEIPTPIASLLAVDYIKFLERTVQDADGNTGKLKGALVHPGDDYELPPGATFADHGDAADTLEKHRTAAAQFKKLGTVQDADGYTLYHAPKSANAIYFGQRGAVANTFGDSNEQLRTAERTGGYTYVHDPMAGDSSDTIMSYAADLGALLCMGGVSHLSTLNPPVEPIFQVFRNWNLDRRRVNEWRMLLAGGARSEKQGAPTRYDEAMLRPPNPNTWRAPMDGAAAEVVREAENTALQMGWVPLFREWFDMARRPTVNALADERLNPNNPTNRAMTRAMAWLLDMPEPV